MSEPELVLLPRDGRAFAQACQSRARPGLTVRLRPYGSLAAEVVRAVSLEREDVRFLAAEADAELPLPDWVERCGPDATADIELLSDREPDLSARLLDCVDRERGTVLAPIGPRHQQNLPLFLISIPKSGTHLLYRLVELLGYRRGVAWRDQPSPGNWYCLEYSNSHTSARDFFIDSVRRSPFGNRHHPFPRTPTLFIYRNPLDVVLSEARYYHLDGKTVFHGYLSQLSLEERLLRLIDDPWLLGSIRDRIGNFIAWLDFPNVIPIAFEELVGAQGGGSAEAQRRLIWSLQLKLQVAGTPSHFGEQIFDTSSPTFKEGQIGSYPKHFGEEAYARFEALPQDFMARLGYEHARGGAPTLLPGRIAEFRRRPLLLGDVDYHDAVIPIEYEYLGHNIVRYQGTYYGVPHRLGAIDLPQQPEGILKALPNAESLPGVRNRIAASDRNPATRLLDRLALRLARLRENGSGSSA